MDKRLMKLLSTRGMEIRGGQMLDTYNQQIQEGVSCTIRTNINTANHHFIVEERNREPQVLTPKRTEFGKAVRKQYESHEIEMSRHDMTTMVPRTDGVSNTLTSVQKDNYLAIAEATAQGYAEAYEGDSVNLAVPNSTTRRGRVGKQMANTLDTGCQQGVVEQENNVLYRIRKLTPRECFRLMGVDDADIDKIQLYPFGTDIEHPAYSYEERLANMSEDEKRKLMRQGISNSQQYKLAGNSIVVDVLYHLFRKLFIQTDCEKENYQQTLF